MFTFICPTGTDNRKMFPIRRIPEWGIEPIPPKDRSLRGIDVLCALVKPRRGTASFLCGISSDSLLGLLMRYLQL